MRYPSFIEKGNTIGFVAPSFGCAGEPYYSAFQNSLKKSRECLHHSIRRWCEVLRKTLFMNRESFDFLCKIDELGK